MGTISGRVVRRLLVGACLALGPTLERRQTLALPPKLIDAVHAVLLWITCRRQNGWCARRNRSGERPRIAWILEHWVVVRRAVRIVCVVGVIRVVRVVAEVIGVVQNVVGVVNDVIGVVRDVVLIIGVVAVVCVVRVVRNIATNLEVASATKSQHEYQTE